MSLLRLGLAAAGGFLAGDLAAIPAIVLHDALAPKLSPAGQNAWLAAGGAIGAGLAVLKEQGQGAVQSDAHGSAAFGDVEQARRALGGQTGPIIGRAPRGWLMRYAGPAHLMTFAPTRSGKGVGAVIPNLLTLDRPIVCIDPKGENAEITAGARRAFGPVHVLDPFGATGMATAAFDPVAALRPFDPDVVEDASAIAEALVYDPPGQVGEAHWNEEAKALITGLILYAVSEPALRPPSLLMVREHLTTAPATFAALLKAMQGSRAQGGLVARAANRQLGKSEREAAGVLSSAQRHTHFLDSPRMAACLGRCDFSFADLRHRTGTVFLVLPPERLATHMRWLRLLTTRAITEIARRPKSNQERPLSCIFLLDEFAALGRLEPLERAVALMAGYGLQLWAILQDLSQLKSLYGEAAGTFLANAGVLQIFNVADAETAQWVSRMLGVSTEAYYTTTEGESRAAHQPFATTSSSTSLHLARRDLMTPDEVMRLPADRLLLLRPGERPLIARKVRYFADPEFRGRHAS